MSLAQRFAARNVHVSLFGVPLHLETADFHEEVTWEAAALVKSMTTGVEGGLTWLPWEQYSLPYLTAPKYKGQFTKKYLEPMEKARQLAIQIVEKLGAPTLKEVKAELEERVSVLKSIDASWDLEMATLDYLVEQGGAERRMWEDVLSWMPSSQKTVTCVEAMAKFAEFENTLTFKYLPLSLKSSFHAAKNYVASIHRGLPPEKADQAEGNMKIFVGRIVIQYKNIDGQNTWLA